MTTKTRSAAGYINVRITKKAHREISRQAIAEGRTFYSQLDRILSV